MANKILGDIVRKQEIVDLNDDIIKVKNYHDAATDFETKLAFKKLLIVLKAWKRRGY